MADAAKFTHARDEGERLRALYRYLLLDTEPEPVFDEVVELAAEICGTPIALFSLVDQHRQWFKSRHGIAAEPCVPT